MVKVSVIVPFYNTEKYFEKCLISLVNQTLKDIEFILVDDGSTDNSLEIANKFANEDSRIKIVRQEHKKQGAARNNGLSVAQGEYIGFVDSDDWIDLEYYEKLYNAAREYDCDIALATNIRIGKGKAKKRLNITEKKLYNGFESMCFVSNQAINPCPTNKIYRKSVLDKNKIVWPEGVYYEDKIFTLKALYYSHSLVSVPDIYYYYYRNPDSTVNVNTSQRKKDKENAKRNVLNFLKDKKAPVKDGVFWATTEICKFLFLTIYKVQESTKSKKLLLFGFIPFIIFKGDKDDSPLEKGDRGD